MGGSPASSLSLSLSLSLCRYFNDSSEEEGGGPSGETEEAVRERLAKEFRWTESSEQEREDKEEEEADPLDAFMAGIEVRVSLLC